MSKYTITRSEKQQ